MNSSGDVEYYMANIETPVCILNVEMFPFDSQTCQITISSYQLMSDQLTIYPLVLDDYSPIVRIPELCSLVISVLEPDLQGNGEWIVSNVTVQRQNASWGSASASSLILSPGIYDNVICSSYFCILEFKTLIRKSPSIGDLRTLVQGNQQIEAKATPQLLDIRHLIDVVLS